MKIAWIRRRHVKVETTTWIVPFDCEGVVHHEYTPPSKTINQYSSLSDRSGKKTIATVEGKWWLTGSFHLGAFGFPTAQIYHPIPSNFSKN